ncbi:MAG TPA: hypothetical protein VJR03_09790 [Nitrospira sp.]|nr:hypothetical protein [Nitrospira sp.]
MRTERHTRAELHQLSKALLRLHKALLDGERAVYERMHGPIASNGAYLQLVLGHPTFAWLRQLSRMMAELDDLSEAEGISAADKISDLTRSLRALLTPIEGDEGFGGRYREALQRDPEVITAHEAVRNLLGD